jgi:UDP:flavonoid glycosyltransferase YjiC (YdhE family)
MKKKIIVAPLNWGLGHASRCVPIIQLLLKNKYTPIIASDGDALTFLQKEFPSLDFLKLPAYNVEYGRNLQLSLLFQLPKIWNAVKKEQ